jgi:hypothetical protein
MCPWEAFILLNLTTNVPVAEPRHAQLPSSESSWYSTSYDMALWEKKYWEIRTSEEAIAKYSEMKDFCYNIWTQKVTPRKEPYHN